MTQTAIQCPNCGQSLDADAKVCDRCGAFVYRLRLEELANAAIRQETADRAAAIATWRQVLALLPAESRQYEDISGRIEVLEQGAETPLPSEPEAADDPLPLALAKTIGSMAISIVVYTMAFHAGWEFAVGFVLLLLIHEMGHVFALRRYSYRASPPIFIPFVGALINLRQPPRNAWEEAVIGIGGPLLGTVGAMACFVFWKIYPQSELARVLAAFGFMLNFFNMIPIPPLDGGRITAAVSPWAWILGFIAIGYWVVHDFLVRGQISFLMILVIIMALPRIGTTLRHGLQRNSPYYQIGKRAQWTMGVAYVSLTVILAVSFITASRMKLVF